LSIFAFLLVLFNAFLVETRQTLFFILKAPTTMATGQFFHTSDFNQRGAFGFLADIFPFRMIGSDWNFTVAVNAFLSNLVPCVFVACPAQVVGLALALRTEVVFAGAAPYPVKTHVYSRLVRNLFTVWESLFQVYLALRNLHNGAAGAFAQIGVGLQQLFKFTFRYLV
jgi:hypothetical protein